MCQFFLSIENSTCERQNNGFQTILILGSFESATLHSRRDLADMNKLRRLRQFHGGAN